MKELLCNDKIYVRFIALYSAGLILCVIAWLVGYYFLPEGVLRGGSVTARLAGEEVARNLTHEFGKIAILNLISGSLIILANMNLRINGYPLGYLIPLLWFTHYGLLLGTNSFSIAMPERMFLSFAVFTRSGLYEMAAYALVAVTTYTFPRYEIKRIFVTNPEKIDSKNRPLMKMEQKIGVILAVCILFLANLREVYMLKL